jgi:hypothetical protein
MTVVVPRIERLWGTMMRRSVEKLDDIGQSNLG